MLWSTLLGPLLLLASIWALWLWSGTPGSLATSLQWLGRVLPGQQRLSIADVQGSLQAGGHIGQLHWQQGGLQIHADQVELRLDWSRFWHDPWPLRELRMKSLHIDDRGPSRTPTPWTSLEWPIPVAMDWQIDRLSWQGTTSVTMTDLRGRYVYNQQAHALTLDTIELAQGRYALQAQLQAGAPMALKVQAQGQILTPASSSHRAMVLDLQTTVQGHLSGPNAQLDIQAQLAPSAADAKTTTPSPQLQLQGQIRPWQSQPVVKAHVEGQALDLALLWPGAPHTSLQGQASIQPSGQDWQLTSRWRNPGAGPWNQSRLPVSSLEMQAIYSQGLWQIEQAQAQVAGGQVRAQARQTRQGWTGEVTLSGLLPQALHSDLSGAAIHGRLNAQDSGSGRIDFQADLNSDSASASRAPSIPGRSNPLPWERLQLEGQWAAQTWDIRSLRLASSQARLDAQFRLDPLKATAQGQSQLRLPGLQAQWQGLLAPDHGQGQLEVRVQDAAQSLSWLQRWPDLGKTLAGFRAVGTGELTAQWQGGFRQTDTPIQLSVKTPHLLYTPGKTATWQLPSGQIQLRGTLQALQAQADMALVHNGDRFNLTARLAAHRPDASSQAWQGQIQSFQLESSGTAGVSPWRAELPKPWAWQGSLQPGMTSIAWEAANWRLQGPIPGNVQVHIDPGQWRAATPVRGAQATASARWEDLPLNWLPGLFGPEVQSDVLMHGQWQLALNQQLSMSASMQRSRGDLRIRAENATAQRLPAGLRQARVTLQLAGNRLGTELLWDSEHMGQLTARMDTVLDSSADGLQWPDQAPIRGQVDASLPKVGAWSVLAPPGWRVQGTLESRLTLSGTRSQPQWQGHLQADNLAVRSAVQGVEFSQGQLQARLQGQEVLLERLHLRGAGSQGGELLAQGQLRWRPSASSGFEPAKALSDASLALQIQARTLRVSNRADRRLAISGDITADLDKGRMRLKGLVQADQALFILPEETTPSLGSDVIVLRTPNALSAWGTDASPPAPAQRSWLGTPDVQVRMDLGSDFRVQGQGLTTRLSGQVLLVSNLATQGQPRLTGQVRTEGGRYKAYGQPLDIETGVLRFNGPYDNPNLDIIALRPNLPQRVGVQVTGTALLPRIRLYADPDMPDADKLAWLVLGRSAASGGAESAVLQQAALALLGGNGKGLSSELATSLGLDEISLASGSRSDATATGAAVTLGKRLSKDFYMVYESSLSGTFGSLYIFYDLSRRLTLRAQAGQQSALDLIFTVRKD